MNRPPAVALNDSTTLPAVGFGTANLRGDRAVESIGSAITTGYRLLDTAVRYENQGALGEAVRRCETPRDRLVLATKLPGRHHEYQAALDTVAESCWEAGVEFWDLYLIHWPAPMFGRYVDAWRALIAAQDRGLVRSIGVSNFLPEHLRTLVEETGVTPAVNQVELHPYYPQEELRALHDELGVVTQAWSPLGQGSGLLDDPVLVQIAQELDRSVAQVVLRWHVQLGVVPLPKAASPEHQAANLDVFDWSLTDAQMGAITGLRRGSISGLDPATLEAQ